MAVCGNFLAPRAVPAEQNARQIAEPMWMLWKSGTFVSWQGIETRSFRIPCTDDDTKYVSVDNSIIWNGLLTAVLR
jgi:hypothetical protein